MFTKNYVFQNTISITIVSLTLFHSQALDLRTRNQNVFIDYAFLGHRGTDMETESQPIPADTNAEIKYNFYRGISYSI